jgi:hypothetical protein
MKIAMLDNQTGSAGCRIKIFLKSLGIDSKKSIPPASLACWAGTTTLFLLVPNFHLLCLIGTEPRQAT